MPRNSKRRSWSSSDVHTLKALARKRTRAASIARTLKRTEGATRQKAFTWDFRSTREAEISQEMPPPHLSPALCRAFDMEYVKLPSPHAAINEVARASLSVGRRVRARRQYWRRAFFVNRVLTPAL
jgi:hypothetical protein